MIYKKQPLSVYHARVNDAAAQLCLQRPKESAQRKVHESGYSYVKKGGHDLNTMVAVRRKEVNVNGSMLRQMIGRQD